MYSLGLNFFNVDAVKALVSRVFDGAPAVPAASVALPALVFTPTQTLRPPPTRAYTIGTSGPIESILAAVIFISGTLFLFAAAGSFTRLEDRHAFFSITWLVQSIFYLLWAVLFFQLESAWVLAIGIYKQVINSGCACFNQMLMPALQHGLSFILAVYGLCTSEVLTSKMITSSAVILYSALIAIGIYLVRSRRRLGQRVSKHPSLSLALDVSLGYAAGAIVGYQYPNSMCALQDSLQSGSDVLDIKTVVGALIPISHIPMDGMVMNCDRYMVASLEEGRRPTPNAHGFEQMMHYRGGHSHPVIFASGPMDELPSSRDGWSFIGVPETRAEEEAIARAAEEAFHLDPVAFTRLATESAMNPVLPPPPPPPPAPTPAPEPELPECIVAVLDRIRAHGYRAAPRRRY
ncbi:hypothetical protein GLOTRDRAFT_129112 [Gloeophyllum trabeum ATCC 11539]|uniref:Uncharacterized protein n=1 Tax=Gloeophyllum trabeum (strain ATCC 11539 / FP-39264 / Madison 617) TaxID=670483 RepID=S7Q7B9_GLOTA|nr:uncharacterized protein GLOTRDRAFT_129112 [Gloeophyllum trabeum ATCC 11539]EPQ55906.1 hypothetical protein GLOTRDRAFT_129112 [Gloeophyllum trabeum ATCC 11539]